MTGPPAYSDQSTFNGADGHIDAFSLSWACLGKSVGDLGFHYTSIPTK